MILEKRSLDHGGLLAIWHITEDTDTLMGMLDHDPLLSKTVFSFQSEKRRLEYLAVRVLLKELLGKTVEVVYDEHNRPSLADKSYNLSITHTGEWAAVLLHPTKQVGIDVERIAEKVVRVKHKFLSENELSFVKEEVEKTHLALMWSVKESMYKALGQVIVNYPVDFEIKPFEPFLKGEINAVAHQKSGDKEYNLNYEVFAQFVLVYTLK